MPPVIFPGPLIAPLGASPMIVATANQWSLAFDGSNDIVTFGALTLSFTYSLCWWMYNEDSGDMECLSSALGDGAYGCYIDGTNIYHSPSSGVSANVAHGGLGATWIHMAITRNGTSVKFYKAGSQIGTTQTLGSNPTFNVFSCLGMSEDNKYPFQGKLDDVRAYTRELSGAEVAVLAGGGNPDSANLEAHWKFEEGSGTTANDSSGNGHTGTISGAVYDSSVPF